MLGTTNASAIQASMNNLSISINGTNKLNYNGKNNASLDITLSSLGAASISHNHDAIYSKLNHTHSYLPLSGGTLSGELFFSAQNKSTFFGITGTVASNDCWRVGGGGTNDVGWLEIATADNGDDPIYVRQYSGVYTSVVRTATLLDKSGNTAFPGSISEAGTSLINKYAAKSHYHSYLPLSGGTMSGGINMQNGNPITWSGFTDNAQIYFAATSDNNGGLYFDLGDDYTPIFYFRIRDITNAVWRTKMTLDYDNGLKLQSGANYHIDNQKGLITAVQSGAPSTRTLWAW